MDKAAAQREADRLNSESPDRDAYRWSIRPDGEDGWAVVRFAAPQAGRDALKPGLGTQPHRPDPGELPPPLHRPEWGPG